MAYCKLISETEIEYAPNVKDGVFNYDCDNNSVQLLKDGYKPLVIAERPADNWYTLTYRETENTIEEVVTLPTDEERQAKRQAEINNLTMTALDFIKVLKSLGLTSEQIHAYLDSNIDLKDELTFCQNVYCGVVKKLCPITVEGITLTAEIVEQAFKTKNGVE